MAQKSIGYVQLIWTCPNCKTKNVGSRRFCKNCGAQMPEDVVFEHPVKEELVTDESKIAEAKAGADIYCGFCGNRNPASAKNCTSCGASLEDGESRESGKTYQVESASAPEKVICSVCGTENPADNLACISCGSPLNTTVEQKPVSQKPAASSKKSGPGCLIGGIILVVLAIAAIYFLFIRTQSDTAVITGTNWQTSVEVLGLVNKQGSDWYDKIPSSGNVQNCSQKVRDQSDTYVSGSKEVCGQAYYVDKGNGYSEKVQDCYYEIYDDYCTYTYQDWGVINVARASGSNAYPSQPVVNLINNQRRGNEVVSYSVTLQDSNGETYQYTPSSLQEYQSFEVNAEYSIEINGVGSIVKLERK